MLDLARMPQGEIRRIAQRDGGDPPPTLFRLQPSHGLDQAVREGASSDWLAEEGEHPPADLLRASKLSPTGTTVKRGGAWASSPCLDGAVPVLFTAADVSRARQQWPASR